MDDVEALKKENRRLKAAFIRLERHYEAERVNRAYNNAPVVSVPAKPKKWW